MSLKTSHAVPPHVLRRNRRLLVACAAIVLPVAGLTMGLLLNQSRPGPLLLAIDEMKVNAQSAVDPAPEFIAVRGPESVFIEEPAAAAPMVENSIALAKEIETIDPAVRTFNGRPIRPVRTMTMVVTAYSPDARSCGEFADGITASGYSVWTNGMKLAAADTKMLPFGTMISVPGYDHGNVIPVLDRGGAIKGNRLDVLYPTHEQALPWGRQKLEVTVWEYADGKPNDFVPRYR